MKSDVNPLNPVHRLQSAPRCTARSKRTGLPCGAPALRGYTVCRFHGAKGGQRSGSAHSGYKHGLRSKEFTSLRALSMKLAKPGKS